MASIRVRRRPGGSRTYQVRGANVKTRSFDLRRDAELYRAEQVRKRSLGSLYAAPPGTFGEALDGLLERLEAELRMNTMRTHRETARLLECFRPRRLPELGLAEVEDELARIRRRAPRQAQKASALVKRTLRSARLRGQVVDDAILEMKQASYEGREPRFLTVDQLFELGSFMPEFIRRIVPVAGLLGPRQSELLDQLDSDLCLEGCAEKEKPHVHVRRGKTKAARRRVELGAETVTLYREQLLARPSWGPDGAVLGSPRVSARRPTCSSHGSHFVFPAPAGGRWSKDNFMRRHFRPAAVAAGLGSYEQFEDGRRHYEGVVFHDLRHTAVSLMSRAGWRFEHVATQVGWSKDSWAAMYARYRHLFDDEMSEQAAKLDELVRSAQA